MKHFPSLTPAARVGEWKYAPGSERPLHSDCDLDAELLVAIARGITGRRRAVALEDLRSIEDIAGVGEYADCGVIVYSKLASIL